MPECVNESRSSLCLLLSPHNLTFYLTTCLLLNLPSSSASKGAFSISLLPRKINIGRRPERPFTGVLRNSLHSDKPPVTSSRDGADQAHTPHPEEGGVCGGGKHSALAAGKSAIKGKMWITSLLAWAISNLRASEL